MLSEIPISHFLILSTLMFFIGVYGFLVRRNMVAILISTELILNSVNINMVAFNKFLYADKVDGQIFVLFNIAVAAAEAAVSYNFV